jgi:hypothetical protein
MLLSDAIRKACAAPRRSEFRTAPDASPCPELAGAEAARQRSSALARG